ncbi:MAG: hypothetical protein IJS47_03140 [Clostridia bacterium]|nr:hypothetical protein [Clostridia bacterium]
MKNISDKLILIFFILIITFPIFTINFKQDTISETEGRYLANFPKIMDSNKHFNTNLIKDFGNWFKDNLGFRNNFMKVCSTTEYTIFNRAISPKVIKGKDEWLYYATDNNLDIIKDTYPNFSETEIKEICEQQIKIRDYLKSKNIEYVLVLTPSKTSIYPEYLYEGYYDAKDTPVDLLAKFIKENSDINIINAKEILLSEKQNSIIPLFYKTDSHWNRYGVKLAYTTLFNQLNALNITKSTIFDFNLFPKGIKITDLATMNNHITSLKENDYLYALDFDLQVLYSTELTKNIQELSDSADCHEYFNTKEKNTTIIGFGDSMNNELMEMLAVNVNKLFVVQNGKITNEVIDLIKPDCIIYQIGERRLSELLYLNNEFLESIELNMESDL